VSAYRSKGKKTHSKWVLKCSKPRSFRGLCPLGPTGAVPLDPAWGLRQPPNPRPNFQSFSSNATFISVY